jgi:hypothetical protein
MHRMPTSRSEAIELRRPVSRPKSAMTVPLMAAMVAVLSFGRAVPASAASPSTTVDLQAVITATGTISTAPGIYHALRSSASGAWNGFNGLSGAVVGMPNSVNGVAIAGNKGELHVLVTNTRGYEANLYHALRSADGAWKGFNNVSGPATVPASTSYAVAAAIVNGNLHVLLVTAGVANLYHAIRFASTGAWAGFTQVTGAPIPGNVVSVAAVGLNGDLHVLITLSTGGGLQHAIRYSSNGAWNGFNNVATAARVPGPTITAVAAAAVGQDLQVLIKTNNDVLYHAIRFSADGAWNGFNDVSSAARVPSGVTFPSIAAAGVNGDLQVLVATSAGKLYHALRSSPDGAWNGLNDVSCCATVPSSTTAVSLAGT